MHLLKKIKIAASFLAVVSLSVVITSCDEDKITKQQVEVNPEERTFIVDSSSFTMKNDSVVVLDTLININLAQEIEYSIDNITYGSLIEAEFSFDGTFEGENPFSFMGGATLKVGDDGGEELVDVAQIVDADAGSYTIMLSTTENDIMPYLETDPLRVVLEVSADGPLPTDMMEFSLDNMYEVELEII